MVQLQVVAYFM